MPRWAWWVLLTLALGGLIVSAPKVFDRWVVEPRLKARAAEIGQEAAQARQEADAAKATAEQERGRFLAAKADAERERKNAEAAKRKVAGLEADRQRLLGQVTSARDQLEGIRKDAATIPYSEVLARVRRALALLRAGAAPAGAGG